MLLLFAVSCVLFVYCCVVGAFSLCFICSSIVSHTIVFVVLLLIVGVHYYYVAFSLFHLFRALVLSFMLYVFVSHLP